VGGVANAACARQMGHARVRKDWCQTSDMESAAGSTPTPLRRRRRGGGGWRRNDHVGGHAGSSSAAERQIGRGMAETLSKTNQNNCGCHVLRAPFRDIAILTTTDREDWEFHTVGVNWFHSRRGAGATWRKSSIYWLWTTGRLRCGLGAPLKSRGFRTDNSGVAMVNTVSWEHCPCSCAAQRHRSAERLSQRHSPDALATSAICLAWRALLGHTLLRPSSLPPPLAAHGP